MEGVGLIFTPVLVRCLLRPPVLSGPITSTSWTHSYSKQSNWFTLIVQSAVNKMYCDVVSLLHNELSYQNIFIHSEYAIHCVLCC